MVSLLLSQMRLTLSSREFSYGKSNSVESSAELKIVQYTIQQKLKVIQ